VKIIEVVTGFLRTAKKSIVLREIYGGRSEKISELQAPSSP
jgi:hypothetical protein